MPLKHPEEPGRTARQRRHRTATHPRDRNHSPPRVAGGGDGAGSRVPDRPRRADAGRQRPARTSRRSSRTWMEPQADSSIAEAFDKNMIDKDEYPQTAEHRGAVLAILADLWHAPDPSDTIGTSTIGSSEACMLGGLALKRRWQHARRAAGKPTDRPNLVMGSAVQVVLGEVRQLLGRRAAPRADGPATATMLDGDETVKLRRREHHRRGRDPRLDIRRRRTSRSRRSATRWTPPGRTGLRRADPRRRGLRRHDRAVPRPGPGVGLPAAAGGLDQHLGPQVRPGLPRRRLGGLARRRRAARGPDLPRQLPRRRHAHVRAQLLPARCPGVAQYYQFLRLGFEGYRAGATVRPRRGDAPVRRDRRDGAVRAADARATSCPCSPSRSKPEIDNYTVFDVSNAMRERGWQLPAYTFPANRTELAALRVVVRRGFTHDMADMLIHDLKRQLPRLEKQPEPIHDAASGASFAH